MVDFTIDCVYESMTTKSEANSDISDMDVDIGITMATKTCTSSDANNIGSDGITNEDVRNEEDSVFAASANDAVHIIDKRDEYVLDSYILCSCNNDDDDISINIGTKDIVENGILRNSGILRNDTFRKTYDRHGDIQRTSSRRVTRKIFRRCSFCAGRILVVDELPTNESYATTNAGNIDDTMNCVISPTSSTIKVTNSETDITSESTTQRILTDDFENNDIGLKDNILTADNDGTGDILENDRSKLKLNLLAVGPPTFIVKSPTPPAISPPPSLEEEEVRSRVVSPPVPILPSPGILNHYSSTIPPPTSPMVGSPNANTFYQAGSLLRQSKYEISTRTSQLVEHTPSRLHTFFTHVLRKRNHGNKHSNSTQNSNSATTNNTTHVGGMDSLKRGSKRNLHKLFHFSSSSSSSSSLSACSPKSTSRLPATSPAYETPAASSLSSSGCVVSSAEPALGRRRFTFGKTLKISQKEYINRRKSMPIQLYRRRGSSVTVENPVHIKDNITESPRYPTSISQAKSYSALGSCQDDCTNNKSRNSFVSTLRRNRKTKSHDALDQSDSDLHLGSPSGSSIGSACCDKAKSHDSLSAEVTDGSVTNKSEPLTVQNKTPKKSKSLLNLFRKKVSS